MQSQAGLGFLIILGCLAMFCMIVVIILFVVTYQRKMLLKEVQIKIMDQEKQLDLFKVSVEAEEKQKEKIARNLHDEINPLLTVLKFNLSRHRIEIKKDKFIPESLIDDEQLLDRAIEGIRSSCLDLIPSFLLQFGLIKSLEEYIRSIQLSGSISAEFEYKTLQNELELFDKQEQLNIYRVCLEILNNLFKHSNCTNLKMSTEIIDSSLIIELIHNGKGVTNEEMDKYTEVSKGLGLKSLKARALILNATINYSKTINNASITLNIPFKNE